MEAPTLNLGETVETLQKLLSEYGPSARVVGLGMTTSISMALIGITVTDSDLPYDEDRYGPAEITLQLEADLT